MIMIFVFYDTVIVILVFAGMQSYHMFDTPYICRIDKIWGLSAKGELFFRFYWCFSNEQRGCNKFFNGHGLCGYRFRGRGFTICEFRGYLMGPWARCPFFSHWKHFSDLPVLKCTLKCSNLWCIGRT